MKTTLRIGFINLYEGCLFKKMKDTFGYERAPYDPDYFVSLINEQNIDIIGMAEVPFDTETGDSSFLSLLKEKAQFPYIHTQVSDKGFVGQLPYAGIAFASKLPTSNYMSYKYFNPDISITRPNGAVWHTHDKYMQTATITLDNGDQLAFVNTHTLPLTLFGHDMNSSVGRNIFDSLNTVLESFSMPVILTGDFNNKDVDIRELLNKPLKYPTYAIKTSTIDGIQGSSYIAISPEITSIDAEAHDSMSDCKLVVLTITIDN